MVDETPGEPSDQAVAEVAAFLLGYRQGKHRVSETPTQPSALRHGGHTSQLLPRDDPQLVEDCAFFEQHGYLQGPRPSPSRVHAFRRLGLPTAAYDSPALRRIVRLGAAIFRGTDGDGQVHCLMDLIGEETFYSVTSDANASPEGQRMPHQLSLCTHTAVDRDQGFLHIADLDSDWRFRLNPFSAGANRLIRRYAGMPIRIRVETETDEPPDATGMAIDVPTHSEATSSEMVGTLCVFSDSGAGTPFDADKLAMLADLADAAAREIEMIFAIRQRNRESDMRKSINDLLSLPLRAKSSPVSGPPGRRSSLTPSLAPSETMPIDSVDLSDLSMPTMFDNAAASLRTHLRAQIAAVIELGVQIGSDHETIESVLGWAADDGIEKWSPIPLEPLVLSVLAAYRHDRSTAFPVGSPTIADLAANNAAHCACLSLPIYDVDGVGRLLLLICSPDEHSIFGRPERSFASLIGQILLGCHAVDRLLLSSQAASAFVSQVSHELRTPLFSLVGALELVREAAPAEALEHLDPLLTTADTCVISLRDVLEDVLLFNTSDASNGSRPIVDADLRQVVRDTTTVGSSRYAGPDNSLDGSGGTVQSDRAAIALEIEDRPPSDWRARFSAAGLQRALLNLISNACKHTPVDGQITLRLSLTRPDEQAADRTAVAVISVTDTGAGMSPEFVKSGLFVPFVQAQQSSQETSGAGLGMSLVHSIVKKRMGGSIDVESALGKGTTVTLRLPVTLLEPIASPLQSYALVTAPV